MDTGTDMGTTLFPSMASLALPYTNNDSEIKKECLIPKNSLEENSKTSNAQGGDLSWRSLKLGRT